MTGCPFLTTHKSLRDESEYTRCMLGQPACVYHEHKVYEKCNAITVLQALKCPKCGEPVLKEIN